ncbi:septin CDC3 [Sugiyamaella lignohabitans]|uniref:Septin CDC3 n=1 Tax=Sugiyamaella lignohabitans TaxID=796027 RepID=A0A170QZ06_9ASCO|nr:septin CDC3 [Sugiyamaella lignohabitans]ANB15997.1 septin CDC3 [Sugiyamaella lignohabitans]
MNLSRKGESNNFLEPTVGVEAPSVSHVPIEPADSNLRNSVVNSNPVPEKNIIHRKLNSYVGFANLPQQWQRKSIKKGFNLNLMVVGESGLGKSTLVSTLFNMPMYGPKEKKDPGAEVPKTVNVKTVSAEIDEGGVRLRLTVIDTPGFGDFVNNSDSWKPIVEDIDRRFDAYLEDENKVHRSMSNDNRIHACIYFIQPTGHSLKPLDILVMKKLHQKVNLVPVIAKSDTMTEEEIITFKHRILEDIKHQEIEIFEPPRYENDDEETLVENAEIMASVPFAIVGSTQLVATPDGRSVRGRSYPWGVIEVDNEEHCDFVKLRQLIIRNHLEELRERTANVLYENYRTDKLTSLGIQQDSSVFREVNPSQKQEEERKYHEARLAKMEADMKNVFQQKVAEKEQKLKKSEGELFARHKEMKDNLEKQRAELEKKKSRLEQTRAVGEEKKSRNKFGLGGRN